MFFVVVFLFCKFCLGELKILLLLLLNGEGDLVVNSFFNGFIFFFRLIMDFLFCDVLVGEFGIVGRFVGEEGGFFILIELDLLLEWWWYMGEVVMVLIWNDGVVIKVFFGSFMVKMVG